MLENNLHNCKKISLINIVKESQGAGSLYWLRLSPSQKSLACITKWLPMVLFNSCNLRLSGLVSLSEGCWIALFPINIKSDFFHVRQTKILFETYSLSAKHWTHCLWNNKCHIQSLEMVSNLLVFKNQRSFTHLEKRCTAEFWIMLIVFVWMCLSTVTYTVLDPEWHRLFMDLLGTAHDELFTVSVMELNHFKKCVKDSCSCFVLHECMELDYICHTHKVVMWYSKLGISLYGFSRSQPQIKDTCKWFIWRNRKK